MIELEGLIHFQLIIHRLEHVARQVRDRGVAMDHLGELVVLQLSREVQVGEASEVVEAVSILQLLHLHFEHEVEGGAEHATEGHRLLEQSTHPEINVIQTTQVGVVGVVAAGIQEIEAIAGSTGSAHHQIPGGIALGFGGGGAGDGAVGAVGGDHIDDRRRVAQVEREVAPAGVGLDR